LVVVAGIIPSGAWKEFLVSSILGVTGFGNRSENLMLNGLKGKKID